MFAILCPFSASYLHDSRGHATGVSASGFNTPFSTSGSLTPDVSTEQSAMEEGEHAKILSEKLHRRQSFPKAKVITSVSAHVPDKGLQKEHKEHGRVKVDVYRQYVLAASRLGFAFFLFATVAQQAASVMATFTLRYWGEHNRETGDNSGRFKYLLVYGLFSLSSSILGALSAITLWVYCALQSSKHLHDSVSSLFFTA